MISWKGKTSCVVALLCLSCVYSEKLKLCVVDGRGGFKRAGRFCPILDGPDSKVECVLGIDRLDCLRRISKGTVDFSVFTPEDLVTAANSEIQVLITNQLRYTNSNFEYEVVAVVGDNSGIKSKHDLRDKKFCHPGYGYETDWTRILSNYLEASAVPQSCQTKFTITENRIKASSEFFQSACKAGPWVNDPNLDEELKKKYPNLCELCDNPSTCSSQDKYWGRRGTLFCLTDGAGDISWARLDDVRVHFGLVPGGTETSPEGYSFLCPDGTTKPVNSTNSCIWVVKPWPVIATKRTSAQDVQEMVAALSRGEGYTWQSALLSLLETYHLSITKLEPLEAIESYLASATGFLNANSFTGCHPPRTIRICTTSVIENAKCGWLRESAAVYGIEPDLDCIKADNTTHCMAALNDNVADVVVVPADLVKTAASKYNLKALFYETVNNDAKYLTVAVTKRDSDIDRLEDLKNRKACFPVYDGVAWNSAVQTLQNLSLLGSCPHDRAMADFFGPSCVPGVPPHGGFKQNCNGNSYDGEFGAINCLLGGNGDVAFVSKNSLVEYVHDLTENGDGTASMDSFKILCQGKSSGCHLSWAPVGQAMVRADALDLWMKDTLDVFLQLDGLFGKHYKSLTSPLQLFGLFDGQSNVLFHDSTVRLRDIPATKNIDTMARPYNEVLRSTEKCTSPSSASKVTPFFVCLAVLFRLFVGL